MEHYLATIRRAYPDLTVYEARLLTQYGQFSDVLVLNETLIFRFPRVAETAQAMAHEVDILRQLQGKLSLSIPNPLYQHTDPDSGQLVFMGYPMLAGEPLWHETFDKLNRTDQAQLAVQLAGFLKVLHGLDVQTTRPISETRDYWTQMYASFRDKLYPYMREEAKAEVSRDFDRYLSDAANFTYRPVLRHGDFGTGNLLFDPQSRSISGIIDFSFVGYGDPAQDVGALYGYGEPFMEACCAVYPEMRSMLHRVRFIRSTYALQQAAYALRDGNQEDFEDGIAEYR